MIGNVHKKALLPKVAHILKTCYDLDIIDEEVILKWGERVSITVISPPSWWSENIYFK